MIERSGRNYSKQEINVAKKGDTTEVSLSVSAVVDYWMNEAKKAQKKQNISKRLGITDDLEVFFCTGFLGIRLMNQYQRSILDSISESKFFDRGVAQKDYDEIEEIRDGISSLTGTINLISEKFKVDLNRKNIIERAINILTAQYYDKDRLKNRIAKVNFDPDKKMLKKWENEWKTQLISK